MFTNFTRIFRSGWRNFKRQAGFSLATVVIMIMIISLATLIFLLQETSQSLIADLEASVDLRIYFEKDLSTEELVDIREELAKVPEIKSIEYVSREEALYSFTARHKGNPVIMESLGEVGTNPFLASLNINAWEPTYYASIADFLESSTFSGLIAKIDYAQKAPAIEKLFSITSTVSRAGIVLGLILVLVVIIIVFNTAKLAIYNSKEEIEIMRLVGASNWFIRGPFLVQGAVCGFLATLIALLLFSGILYFISPKLVILAPGLDLFAFFLNNFFIILAIQLFSGVGLGVLSSWLAIRKYLRV
jgi:cell division transport system permease protein